MADEKCELLLEEWKQNIALYIDQDKRGLERIKMFLTVNAGLFVLYGILWKDISDLWSMIASWLVAIGGIFFVFITKRMSRRAHRFVQLRRSQGLVIESAIKKIIAPDSAFKSSNGLVTTFSREYILSSGRDLPGNERDELLMEFSDANIDFELKDKKGKQLSSMSHLDWLMLLHNGLYIFWISIALFRTIAWYFDC